MTEGRTEATRAWVLHPDIKSNEDRRAPSFALAEAVSLACALPELEVVGSEIVPLPRPQPGLLFGSGKIDDLKERLKEAEIELVLIDGPVTPVQQRNLEKAWNIKLLDRTGLILEIFSDRAATREGVLQVEMAALSYQRTRLVRAWTHLERQRGGLGFVGGPGETQIEADRRAIDTQLVRLRRQLEKVVKTRSLHRAARAKVPYPIVALVGYTNAGFISALPTELVAAFRATLEEVLSADIIVHVRDISHPETDAQAADVAAILADLGVDDSRPVFEIWNKIAQMAPDVLETVRTRASRAENVFVTSALTGEGIDPLLAEISARLQGLIEEAELHLAYAEGRKRAWLFERDLVQAEAQGEEGYTLQVRWNARDRARFESL